MEAVQEAKPNPKWRLEMGQFQSNTLTIVIVEKNSEYIPIQRAKPSGIR